LIVKPVAPAGTPPIVPVQSIVIDFASVAALRGELSTCRRDA
jgi:hypothetical protein